MRRSLPSRALLLLCAVITLLAWTVAAVAGPNDGLPKPAETLDRATPRRAFVGFHEAVHASDYLRAAHFLDLRNIARNKQAAEGAELARKLAQEWLSHEFDATSKSADKVAAITAYETAADE